MSAPDPDDLRPRAGMTRTVPGWRWLQGPDVQAMEWKVLEQDFWSYIRLNTWDVAVIKKSKRVDEQRGHVILHMEADVFGKIVPESFRIRLAPK